MKRYFVIFSAIALVSFTVIACSKDNEQDVANNGSNNGNNGSNGGNNNSCDTANVKFSTGVLPILQANCYSCHGNGQVNGGVALDNFNTVRTRALNGSLIGVITHAQGYPAMPQGGAKLSDCNINKIRSWINNGAQNN
jgi:cytochrome c553